MQRYEKSSHKSNISSVIFLYKHFLRIFRPYNMLFYINIRVSVAVHP